MKAKNVAGYRNYDSSEFTTVSPLLDDDDALEALWKKQASLQEFVAPDQFKSYDALKTRLNFVLGNKTSARQDPEVIDEEDRGSAEQLVSAAVAEPVGTGSESEDDPLSYFAKLAAE